VRIKRILITGANRGIGYALARQYLQDGHLVAPTYRRKSAAESLFVNAASEPQNWLPVRYDTAEPETVADLAKFVDQKLGQLDLLINNAGMSSATSGYPRETSPIILNILSNRGSITQKDAGGNYGYSLSKAALSMVTKILAADLGSEGFIVVGIHPGWVRTRMGGPGGFLTPEESASFLAERIRTLKPKDNGALLNWDGSAFVV
jgi:NAD(P)-dependent dehydrogenase (short-subunit alcohol dehydrogenase family)